VLPNALLAALLAIAVAPGIALGTAPADAGEPGTQEACPRVVGTEMERGWAAYRSADLAAAREAFAAALERCPDHADAVAGVGYVALREGDDEAARERFRGALELNPVHVDALVGLGLVAWRAGDLRAVARRFERVRELDPDNATARAYLARLPEGLGPAPERPPLALPDSTRVAARVRDGRFEVPAAPEPGERVEPAEPAQASEAARTADAAEADWRPFYVKGVNLGAALPGRFPSQFPEEDVYRRWIGQMAEAGFNVVRAYTIHPPGFYRALADHNAAHPRDPLRLIHGVWTELPPGSDYDDPAWRRDFVAEMRRVVDVVHGRADLEPRPGHASGHYTADVSRWTLAWIIGREWEPYSVEEYDDLRAGTSDWRGDFLEVRDGSPTDVWLARACEKMVAYETERYRQQRPVAYTNWPTLDPLHHPTETTTKETWSIRRALGERVGPRPPRYDFDDDAVSLDATTTRATDAFRAGWFAAYHVYPYYPDFMVLDPGYREARSPFGPSTYWGYLRELKDHHGDMALLVAEYGVPASLGIAHLQPQGWHHGGHTEEEMARIDVRLTREIAAADLAGGVLFAWMDEWFKQNWLVQPFELPAERNRLWYNRMDAGKHEGVLAMEPEPAGVGQEPDGRAAAWAERPPLYRSTAGEPLLRAAADAAALWLRVDVPDDLEAREILVGFDMVGPSASAEGSSPGPGDVRWPAADAPASPVGMEIVLRARRDGDGDDEVRVLADGSSNPFRLEPVREEMPPPGGSGALEVVRIEDAPPGHFHGRVDMRYDRPYVSRPGSDGAYDSLRVVTNRARLGRDSTEFAALGYDRGVLPGGERPDGYWSWSADGRRLEVRVPWLLLNVTDPSSRAVLQDDPGGEDADDVAFGTIQIPDVGLVLAVRDGEGSWRRWPASGTPDAVARWSWPTWEEPAWTSRRRPAFEALRHAFRDLEPFGPQPSDDSTPEPDTSRREGGP
jgi:hypothetical protein